MVVSFWSIMPIAGAILFVQFAAERARYDVIDRRRRRGANREHGNHERDNYSQH